ncbi:MAG: hypothetical protein NG747_07060 [Candidatus Brocadia sp.]|nr:hypothetical protein [Candidatus Brocadia sp.]
MQKSARPVFVIFEVSGKAVGDDNAVKEFSRDGVYDLRTAGGADSKKGEALGDKYPEPCKSFVKRV